MQPTRHRARLWEYAVPPVAFAMVLVLRQFGLVATVPWWMYAIAILAPAALNHWTESWHGLTPNSVRSHVRIALHVLSVTASIYISGWGPAAGMAYVFSAQADMEQSGARVWRAALGWSVLGCATGQLLVFVGWAPSLLGHVHAQTIGLLGIFLFSIAIRKAGESGEHKEAIEAELAQQVRQAKDAENAALRNAAHHRAVVENAAEGILTLALDGTITSFNAAAEAMYGWPANEIVGQAVTVLVPPALHDALGAFLAECRAGDAVAAARSEVEVECVRSDGTRFPIMFSTSLIDVGGYPAAISAIVRDLSEQKQAEAQLAHQVLHDALTGLPNRVMLIERLNHALARTRRTGTTLTVLFIDLDRFKFVNDTLGHGIGDRLLIEAASRICGAVRDSDTVSRLGGDEFVVLCEEVAGVRHATELAQRVTAALAVPFVLGEDETHISASIGIAMSSEGEESAEALLQNADVAMYRAKDGGRARCELFDETMQRWVAARIDLEVALRQAVARNELRVFYQPFVESASGDVVGFEALVRWDRPGFGLVPPNEFIPVAEETGLIIEIGEWVLEQACRQAVEWRRRWPGRRLGIAVNVSSRQILKGDIVDVVRRVLERTGLNPRALTLELTESTLIDDSLGAGALLRRLRDIGVNLALDDFGTGYSSLTYLRGFPIDIIKIERSFVSRIGAEKEDRAIVAAVVALAKNLDIRVVAEGIENHEQLAALVQLGCDYLQGYLFAHPAPEEVLATLVEGGQLGLPSRTFAT